MKCERCGEDTDDIRRYLGKNVCKDCYLKLKHWKERKQMNEPLTDECRYQVMPDASIRRNKDADILVLSDVRSAVELLKKKFDVPNVYGGRGPFFTREQVNEFIDSCFPVFRGEK